MRGELGCELDLLESLETTIGEVEKQLDRMEQKHASCCERFPEWDHGWLKSWSLCSTIQSGSATAKKSAATRGSLLDSISLAIATGKDESVDKETGCSKRCSSK